jgi:RNA polymerase sigma-70 factor (ECF subfamily)
MSHSSLGSVPGDVTREERPDLYAVMSERMPPQAREQRFTRLFAECYGPVLAFARRRLGPDLAQDVVAETFLTAWRRLDELSGEPLPWLYRIAGHTVANQRRGQARRLRLDDRARRLIGEGTTPDPAEAVSEKRRLVDAFNALSEPDREALRLVSWEGLPTAAAAFVLECSPATFKVRLHRARRRLSQLLGEERPRFGAAPAPAQTGALPCEEITP